MSKINIRNAIKGIEDDIKAIGTERNHMTNWVKFTGEGEQEYNGEILARVNGVGGVYLLGGDEKTGDVVLLGSFDGPVNAIAEMFGGRFTGANAYVDALNHVVKEVITDIS